MASALLLCDDLLFGSRIAGEGRARAIVVKSARSVEQIVELARQEEPSCVFVDLGVANLDLAALFHGLGEVCPTLPRIVAFGSHVNTDSLQAARAAGCDPVLPRSKFVEELPHKLSEWLSS